MRHRSSVAPIDGLILVALGLALLVPAVLNGFPLIFPDSGTYFGIAFSDQYAIDRSSLYGFFLKPFVQARRDVSGLWLAIVAQCLLLAAALWPAARLIAGGRRAAAAVLAATLLLTSLAWHAGQFMPDAFTGATVLLAWLAARRDPSADGAPLLWLAAILAALMHYTHVPLLVAAAGAALIAAKLAGIGWRAVGRRAVAAVVAAGIALGVQFALNLAVLQRPAVAPMGPLFLFARLNEDGLMQPWLAAHCGRDAPTALCELAPSLPRDSQTLLWGGTATPVSALVWHNPDTAQGWAWVDQMAVANRGAIRERPLQFLASSGAGFVRQLLSFAALDDECPAGCYERKGGIGFTLQAYRPMALPALDASRQVTDRFPKAAIRAVTTPITALAMLLLLPMMVLAWRRRDEDGLGALAAVAAALLVNAALAGALSDVHDRYQSRVAWLAPFVVLLVLARWRTRVNAGEGVVEPWGIERPSPNY